MQESTQEYAVTKQHVAVRIPGQNMNLQIPKESIVDIFHVYYWDNYLHHRGPEMLYNGVPIHKHPCDLFNYQQIIFEQQPDFIIECGSFQGGAALFFANLMDLIGKGNVISIDICERDGVWHQKVKDHERTILLPGSSIDDNIIEQVKGIVGEKRNNFIILDSLHWRDHVLQEMFAYAEMLSPGNYMVVEDSNLNGHPIPKSVYNCPAEGGPFEAVEMFMKQRNDFQIDNEIEQRFLFSFAPSGYLIKK